MNAAPPDAERGRQLAPVLAAGLCFAVMAVLFASGLRAPYDAVLRAWGIDAFAFPFLDTDTVLSAVRCLRSGLDVFVANPCDPLQRVYDYSPLWLLLAHLPITKAALPPIGFGVDVAFILSLLLLPAGRDRRAAVYITLGAVSSSVAFAVERGNNDLVLFVLAGVAATLASRGPVLRSIGYAAALLAGLLKYYPMLLMALAFRERPARFLAVTAASIAITALFLVTMGHDLVRALQLIPKGSWYGDMFGASTLPGGIAHLFDWPQVAARGLQIVLTLAALGLGCALGSRPALMGDIARLDARERTFLLAGAMLILGAYFTAQNIGYRATHLVLVLPAATALSRIGANRQLYAVSTGAILALLWTQAWRQALEIAFGERGILIGWLLREALWWWTAIALIAAATAILVESEMGRVVFERLRLRGATPAKPVGSTSSLEA